MRQAITGWSSLLLLLVAVPVAAQADAVDQLAFTRPVDNAIAPAVKARAFQVYRIPFSYELREMTDDRWGVRLTFPVSLSAARLQRMSGVGSFAQSLGLVAVVPGVELEIPARAWLRLRPFVEVGVGKSTLGGSVQLLYAAGLRARVTQASGPVRLMFGGSAMRRHLGASGDAYGGHSLFEGAVDAQVPLGFSVGQKVARGGAYTIVRGYEGLESSPEGPEPLVLGHQIEAGISFSTAPALRVWKITVPWLAVGYQFGPVISGVRIYSSFPF